MDSSSPEDNSKQTDQYPLLMERVESHSDQEHIINVTWHDELDDASSSSALDELSSRVNLARNEYRSSSSTQASGYQTSSSNGLNSRNSSFTRHRRSPLNSALWILFELLFIVSQITASVVVLSLSRNEKPEAPLFTWIVGYASGCVAKLPILYWRYRNRNGGIEQDSLHSSQGSSYGNPSESTPFTAIAIIQALDEDNDHITESTRHGHISGTLSTRFDVLVDRFKMVLDCFFAVWFIIGNMWIFGGHSSPSDAPKMYRLCVVFLTFSFIGYAMPFILCAAICCCLPCIISVLGFREHFSPTRGATMESISALPAYRFKSKKIGNVDDPDVSCGVLASGTAKERVISGEDAVCCICLAAYADDDELRELPCIHVFHVKCVDKWLRINACCPLCKTEVGNTSDCTSPSTGDSN
ncbi:hypothetical protein Goklo_017907 [Gossypium klotzschianum]|uniref:RING-type domain-containing protein n=1 Tax=Gossypium klotzschianum TaxID=34286 RepID=A0A7J8UJ61_9ROSI|nr:hypothetical protein [Gossypium klotzschianum]